MLCAKECTAMAEEKRDPALETEETAVQPEGASPKKKKEPETPAAPATKKCPYCLSEIPIEAVRCPHCTSHLEEDHAA